MEILRTIALYTETQGMPFLIIGGHAVNSYGISRQTGDLDLLARRDQRQLWHELMLRLRYLPGQYDEKFARYRFTELGAWPIDLMFVENATFETMFKEAHLHDFGLVEAKVVSIRHLIALKIHALKVFQEHRRAKDFSDTVLLLRSEKSGVSDQELRALCERYANKELYEEIKSQLAHKQKI